MKGLFQQKIFIITVRNYEPEEISAISAIVISNKVRIKNVGKKLEERLRELRCLTVWADILHQLRFLMFKSRSGPNKTGEAHFKAMN